MDDEQKIRVYDMFEARKTARQEYNCWQEKLTKWGRELLPLAEVMSAHPTDPRKEYASLVDAYPSREEVEEALEKIHALHQEIERLNEQLRDFK